MTNNDSGNDHRTTLAQLRQTVAQFVDQRDWQQFHSPKNLSMSLSIEVGELMEHFQWISMNQSRQICDDPSKQEQVADEMADVLCYLLALANELEIDLSRAFWRKMEKNRAKYPADTYKGKYGEADLAND